MVARAGWSPRVRDGQGGRRARSSPTTSTSPSRSPSCPRTGSWRCSAARRRSVLDLDRSSRSRDDAGAGPTATRRRIAARFGIADPGRPGRPLAGRHRALGLAHPDPGPPRHRPADAGCGRRPRTRPSGCSPPTCATCCSPRPAGTRPTMGLDPGLRTGVKVAVVDAHRQGASPPTRSTRTSRARSGTSRWPRWPGWPREHGVELVAIGNGTASRETDKLAGRADHAAPGAEADQGDGVRGRRVGVLRLGVRLAGAARPGRVAARRGLHRPPAAGPARRAGQDRPASRSASASTSTTCPRSKLSRSLDAVVEDCVNARRRRRQHRVGAAADPGVRHRRRRWPRTSCRTGTPTGRSGPATALKEVPRLGPKAFEQCAGFLRIRGGDDPLDASSVHPEAYPVVRRILAGRRRRTSRSLIGNSADAARRCGRHDFVDDTFGLPTVTDILAELEKPGRDPRPGVPHRDVRRGRREDRRPAARAWCWRAW